MGSKQRTCTIDEHLFSDPEHCDCGATRSQLMLLAKSLADDYRMALENQILEAHREGYTYAQIASVLSYSQGWVWKLARRAQVREVDHA